MTRRSCITQQSLCTSFGGQHSMMVQEKYPNQEIPVPIQLLLWIFTPAPPGSPIWVVCTLA